jgi:hypothetical protein
VLINIIFGGRTVMKKMYISLAVVLLMVITSCGGGGGGDATAPAPLSSAKAITAYSLAGVAGTIDETGKTIAVTMPSGTTVTALVATFTATSANVKVGGAPQTSGTTANDFTNPVVYTVTAADSSTATYTVTVTVAASSAKAITAFSLAGVAGTIDEAAKTITVTMPSGTTVTALVATFTTTGANVKVGSTTQTSGTTANNFTNPVVYTVTAADTTSVTYTVTVTVALSSAKAITTFSLAGVAGTINEAGKTIAVTMPSGTTVTALVATFTTTGANVKVGGAPQTSGTTANNFTNPVVYTVTAADTTSVTYTVTVTVALSSAKAITAFSLAGVAGTINEAGKTIAVSNMPYGTELTALVATFTTTGVSVTVDSAAQTSGATANDFTNPVVYKVTAADTSSVTYTVTVTVAASSVSLPQTGQTTCYDASGNVINCTGTGEDGALLEGVAWPSARFTDNGDETITDNLTGLMWTQNANAPGPVGCTTAVEMTWQNALNYAACLNTHDYLGHNDWRLPNRKELFSLANFSQSNIATWLGTQGFSNVQAGYWSSTTYVASTPGTDIAWAVNIIYGSVYAGEKSGVAYVWAVRGGQ